MANIYRVLIEIDSEGNPQTTQPFDSRVGYSPNQFSGSPYKYSNSLPNGYEMLSGQIQALNDFGTISYNTETQSITTIFEVRAAIKLLYSNGIWEDFSNGDKEILSKWFVCSASERLTIHTLEQQRENADLFYTLFYGYSREVTDYRIIGYIEKKTFNSLGDITVVSYYNEYEGNTYKDLRVTEAYTYYRDNVNGLVWKRTKLLTWYIDGVELPHTKFMTKIYSAKDGYQANKQAAQNLVDDASMYLVSVIGITDGRLFLNDNTDEIDMYIAGNRAELLSSIQAYTFSANATTNATIKFVLNLILNVQYT